MRLWRRVTRSGSSRTDLLDMDEDEALPPATADQTEQDEDEALPPATADQTEHDSGEDDAPLLPERFGGTLPRDPEDEYVCERRSDLTVAATWSARSSASACRIS